MVFRLREEFIVITIPLQKLVIAALFFWWYGLDINAGLFNVKYLLKVFNWMCLIF